MATTIGGAVGFARFPAGGARLGWPRVLRRWAPVGLGAGGALGVLVAVTGFPDWSVLLWQLLQCAALATGFTALAFWAIAYGMHSLLQGVVPLADREPMPVDYFWMARPAAAAATVVGSFGLAVTAAFTVGIGEWYSFFMYP